MTEYCCEKFKKVMEEPASYYFRETTFRKHHDGEWWTDFSDDEYGDIKLTFCPFCGTKLQEIQSQEAVKN